MKTLNIKGWSITPYMGTGRGPDFAPTQFFTVVGTKVKTETRVDIKGLEQILPADIFSEFQSSDLGHNIIEDFCRHDS